MEPGFKRLSDALSEPLTKAYQAGGFGLAFLVLGAIFLAASALAPRGVPSYLLAAVGFLLVVVPCYFFYVKEIRPIASAQKRVEENKELLDLIQDAALKMTNTARDLRALTYKHAEDVTQVLHVARPAMARIPVLGKVAESAEFERADWLASKIVSLADRSERVLDDVKEALVESDPSGLKSYLGELDNLGRELEELLQATAASAPPPIASDAPAP
jgi:hypothetical protein